MKNSPTTTVRALTALAVFSVLPMSAFAGFTATTGIDTVSNIDTVGGPGADPGDSFSITPAGTFTSFVGDNPPADPSVTGGDLNFYRYLLTATVDTVTANTATYTGTYSIFYDLNQNGLFDEGLLVSGGTAALSATFSAPNNGFFTGTLTQTQGPSNPAFRDLGATYGGNPVDLTGTYIGSLTDPTTGTLQATLRQNAAPVPEPASLAALGLGALGLLRARRRASK